MECVLGLQRFYIHGLSIRPPHDQQKTWWDVSTTMPDGSMSSRRTLDPRFKGHHSHEEAGVTLSLAINKLNMSTRWALRECAHAIATSEYAEVPPLNGRGVVKATHSG